MSFKLVSFFTFINT